jgi:hypothetical protein
MSPRQPRERRHIGLLALLALRPFLRYSESRDAYILRIIGRTRGPVYVRRQVHRRRPARSRSTSLQ